MSKALRDLLEGDVKFKKNNVREKAKRVTSNASEVMVKISGNTKNAGHTGAHLDYISRNGKIELENERGEIISGRKSVKELNKEWSQDLGNKKANTRDTTKVVLSMPKGTDADAVKNAAREFAKKQFSKNHQYVFALHTDADHPHVHLTIKNLGFDGKRLHVKKGDPQKWREQFAEELLVQGVDAEATPRSVRGVVKKPVKQTVKHIRDKGKTPEVDKAKIREIVEDFDRKKQGKPERARPWEDRIKERQTNVRKSWLEAAKDLNQSSDESDKSLAKKIVGFVQKMPPLKTERHELQEKLSQKLSDYISSKNNQKDNQEER